MMSVPDDPGAVARASANAGELIRLLRGSFAQGWGPITDANAMVQRGPTERPLSDDLRELRREIDRILGG